MIPSISDIEDLIRLQLGLRWVNIDHRFMEDLGAESADLVNIFSAAEDKFGVSFEEDQLARVRSLRDLYTLCVKQPK
jgi:acyl carrier protein